MPGGIIGEADIVVGADATGLASDVQKQAQKQLANAGQQLGRELAQSVQKGARAAAGKIPAAVTSQLSKIPQSAQQAAAKLTSSLSSAANAAGSRIAKLGNDARSSFGGAVAAAQQLPGPIGAFANASVKAFADAKNGLSRFAAGWKSSEQGLSSFSGKLGTLGTAARSAATLAGNALKQGIGTAANATFTAVQAVASRAWSAVSRGAAAAARTAGQALKVGIGGAAKAAGALIATGVGASLAKGFKRLSDLDQAQARLKGLGIAGKQTASIMRSVDKAVTGTAFSAADAAKAAGVLATSGVKAGSQMSGALDAVVASAAASGREIGDITPIFAKVAAAGKLTGDTMQQMLENGINVSGALQKSLGKNADEIAKMVSSGQISFSEFTNALNGDLGLLAAAMGGTLSGMTKNVGAAMGRIGAAVQKPVFNGLLVAMPAVLDFMKRLSAAVTEFMAPLEDKLKPLAENLASVLNGISFDSGGIGNFMAALAPLIPLLGAIAGMAGGALSSLPVIGGMFSGMTGPIGLALGALAAFTAVDPSVMAQGFESLLGAIPGIVEKLVSAVSTVLPKIAANLSGNIGVLADALVAGIPLLINAGIELVMALGQGLIEALPQLVQAAVSGVTTLVTGLVAALPQLIQAGITLVLALVDGLLQALPQLITALVAAIPTIISALVTALPALIQGAIQLFLGLLDGLAQALPQIITAVIDAIPVIIDALVGAIPTLIDGAIDLFLGIIDGLTQAIPQIITAIINAVPQLIEALVSALPKLIEGAIQLFLGIVTGLLKALPEIIDAVIGMIPKIVSALIDATPKIIEAGKDLIAGLVQGIVNSGQMVLNAIGDVVNGAIDWAKDLLGIASPSKVFKQLGEFTGQGFAKGLGGTVSQVRSATKKVVDTLVKEANKLIADGKMSKAGRDAAVRYAKGVNRELVKLAKQREKVTKSLAAAEKKLAAAKKVRDDFAASVKSAVVARGDITESRTSTSMVRNLQKQITSTKAFAATIKKLRALGLDKTSLAQLVEDFNQNGSTRAADALLAGGKPAVKQVATLQKQLAKAGGDLGKSTSKALYQAGVDSAQGFVKGFESDLKKINKAADKLSDRLVKGLKKRLGIKSPSRVMAALANFSVDGFLGPLSSRAREVGRAMRKLVNPAATSGSVAVGGLSAVSGPLPPVPPVPPAGAAGGGRTVIIEAGAIVVNGTDDPAETAREVLDAIAEELELRSL